VSEQDEIQLGLDNTTESWKRGLLDASRELRDSARESSTREKWILRVAVATLMVAVATLLVAVVR
jgi:hypothetical protein